jgi:hypothetical protein
MLKEREWKVNKIEYYIILVWREEYENDERYEDEWVEWDDRPIPKYNLCAFDIQ